MNAWTEVRRSVPATEMDAIPDEATVWACWMTETESITVYREADDEWYLVLLDEAEQTRLDAFDSEGTAMREAKALRANAV